MVSAGAISQQEVSPNPGATPGRNVANDSDMDLPSCLRGTGRPSLSDFAEQFERLINEKRDLMFRLNKALDENLALNQLHKRACDEFDCERARLNAEIVNVRSKPGSPPQSILAAKEKLIREEFERKFQELTLQVRQSRHRYMNAAEEVKKKLASCICGAKSR
jgi:hypothetical protein